MTRRKRGRWAIALCLFPLTLGLLAGCGSSPPATRAGAATADRGEDPLEGARDVLRKATDAAAYRDALQLINAHLGRDTEASAHLQKIKDQRDRTLPPARLREVFGLDPDEVEEIEAVNFRPLDAQHVAQAFELRDAARALQLQELPKLKQAELAFQWVMRQVLLQVRDDELLPPQPVLHAGQGTAHERALVFLALLQQLNLDGCMIAVPGAVPDQVYFWVPGVLIAESGRRDIYLFDARLGLPLPGPGGKGIATLDQLRKQPELLRPLTGDPEAPYDITPQQARKAEVYLVCPLSALAPRMKFLEDLLASFDRVKLAVDPGLLLERFQAAAGGRVHVWNGAGKPGRPAPNTPTRALRQFVSVEEGGLDRTGKAQRFQRDTLPLAAVTRTLRDLRLGDELQPLVARVQLQSLAANLYVKYAVTPHDYLLRGRLDETTRRLVRGLAILDEFNEAHLPEAEFLREVARWREQRVKPAYLDGTQKALDALWSEDQHLLALIAPTADEGERQKLSKKVLTFIIVRSVAAPLRRDASYLLALCWQEKAERLQAQRERHRPGGKEDARATQRALDAWLNVQGWWQKYADHYPFNRATVKKRLAGVANLWRSGAFILAVGLWEQEIHDWRAGFHARLLQADGLEKSGMTAAARTLLQGLAVDLGALPKDTDLKTALAGARGQAERQQLGDLPARLRNLERELGSDGSFAWMRATALYRLRQRE
jgi:hypothetical protein